MYDGASASDDVCDSASDGKYDNASDGKCDGASDSASDSASDTDICVGDPPGFESLIETA
jgi:hypothetical protein